MTKNLLLETSLTKDIVCKYCGNPYATENYETGPAFRPSSYRFKGDSGYSKYIYCQFCGWSEYRDYYEYAKDYGKKTIKDPFVEYKPEAEQIASGKKILKMLKKASDKVDEVIREALMQNYNPLEDDINDLKLRVIKFIFHWQYPS